MSGRILVFGDIHGCDNAFETLLGQLRITAADTVILLGDIIDRGPGTRQVIERAIQLNSDCQLRFIMGNHEQMLLQALDSSSEMSRWLMYGGREALDSYDFAAGPKTIPDSHIEFLRSGLDYYETATDVFVHASLEPGVPLQDQNEEWLRWSRFTGREEPLESGQRVICGHTSQKSGLPCPTHGWVCIDTYVYGDGWLTCLDVQTDEFFQADEQGQFRTGHL